MPVIFWLIYVLSGVTLRLAQKTLRCARFLAGLAVSTPQEPANSSHPLLQLTPGQISSLTDKLNNALVSIQAGLNKQAINQLNALLSSVQSSLKNGKISATTATTLTTAANAIIAKL